MVSIQNQNLKRLAWAGVIIFASFLFGTFGYWCIGMACDKDWPLFKCAYLTLITLSTVGFGDVLGVDASGNYLFLGFTGLVMVMGLGSVAYATSVLTVTIIEGDLKKMFRRNKMQKELSTISDHYIVCGGGSTGGPVIDELVKSKLKVVVIDHNSQHAERWHEKHGALYVVGDSHDDEILTQAGIKRARGIFAVLPTDKDNLFVTVTARHLNPNIRVLAKFIDPKMRDKLISSGANGVVSPNMIGGLRMAAEMVRPAVVRFLDKMLREKGDPHRFEEIEIEKGAYLDGKTLADSEIQKKTGMVIVAVMFKNKEETLYNPPQHTHLDSNCILVTIGSVKEVEELRKFGRA